MSPARLMCYEMISD
uniref:Uncharacterized protein n=1 Tax=Anguilla anguilla TaxID=7936 RepID=A0A0E9UWS1_ANGAN